LPAVVTGTTSEPEEALEPDQEPDADAEQVVLEEVQVSVTFEPTRASVTLDDIVKVGADPPPPPPPPQAAIKSSAGIVR